jgi:hypothetical protein
MTLTSLSRSVSGYLIRYVNALKEGIREVVGTKAAANPDHAYLSLAPVPIRVQDLRAARAAKRWRAK